MEKKPHEKMLEKAKIQLMMLPETMFYTTILFSLKTVWTDELPTAAVDGTSLYINPDFFIKQSEKSRIGLSIHEVLHIALNHITRKGNRNHKLWNMAGDYVINNLLDNRGYELPHEALIDHQYDNLNTEQVYLKLEEEAEKNPTGTVAIMVQGGSLPGMGDDVIVPKTAAQNSAVEQAVADIVMRAAVQAKNSGNGAGAIPGEVMIEIDRITNPKLPWNVIFQNFMQSFAKDDYSWHRPNKRFLPEYYLPTAYGEAICNIAAAVDCSGSVSDADFNHFIGEIDVIQETLHPEEVSVIDFDTKIHDVQKLSEHDDAFETLQFTGRGGTDVLPVLQWAKDNEPKVLIVFTDGDFFKRVKEEHKPETPVIWLIHNNPNFTCCFGEVVHYDIN